MSISPVRTIAVVKPGNSLKIPYTIKNTGEPTVVSFSVRKAKITPDGLLNVDDQNILPLQSTINIKGTASSREENSIFIQSNEKKKVIITLSVPYNLSQKDYYLLASASSQPGVGLQEGSGYAISSTVTSPILLSVTQTGQLQSDPQIKEISITGYKLTLFGKQIYLLDSFSNIEVLIRAQNSGIHQTMAQGSITLQGPLGQNTRVPILQSSILADSSRILQAPINYICIHTTNCNNGTTATFGGFFVGKYTIRTNVQFANYPANIRYFSILALPFSMILSIIIIFAVFWFVRLRGLKVRYSTGLSGTGVMKTNP